MSARRRGLSAALLACALAPACGDDGGESESEGPGEARWGELVRGLDGGVLLSAANVGDAVVFVGGQMSAQPGVAPGGPGYLVRYEDGALCREDGVHARTLWWIDSPAADEWYAVGEGGAIVHERAGARVDESVATDAALYGVRVHGDVVYAVGGDVWGDKQGEIWRRDPAGVWAPFASELAGVVFKVWDGWFVGEGVAWYLDGDALIERHPPSGAKLLTARGGADGEVWAVGGAASPTLLRWAGDAWESVAVDSACAQLGLNGIWVDPAGELTIAGTRGGLGFYSGAEGGWSCPDGTVSLDDLHVAWGRGDERFVAGGNLLSAGNNFGSIIRYGPAREPISPADVGPCP